MKLLPGGALAIALLAAPAVHASGLNLAWDACVGDAGAHAKFAACDTNAGSNALVGSFVLPSDLAGVTGIECVLDLIVGDGVSPIPPWWDMYGPGACRPTALTAVGTPASPIFYCADWAGGLAEGGVASFSGFETGNIAPVNVPAHRRIKLGFAVPLVYAADLVANQEYYGFTMSIGNVQSVGTGSCTGCLVPACIVLNSINVVPGTAAGIFLQQPSVPGSNFATWQASPPSCSLVPTRRASWGAVKQLFR